MKDKGVFVEEHLHKLDSRGRLVVPACHRKVLASHRYPDRILVIKAGPPAHLACYPYDDWVNAKKALKMLGVDITGTRADLIKCSPLLALCRLDEKGRIELPPDFVEHASFLKQCLVAGAFDSFELWNPDAWQRHREGMARNPELNAAAEALGF